MREVDEKQEISLPYTCVRFEKNSLININEI